MTLSASDNTLHSFKLIPFFLLSPQTLIKNLEALGHKLGNKFFNVVNAVEKKDGSICAVSDDRKLGKAAGYWQNQSVMLVMGVVLKMGEIFLQQKLFVVLKRHWTTREEAGFSFLSVCCNMALCYWNELTDCAKMLSGGKKTFLCRRWS